MMIYLVVIRRTWQSIVTLVLLLIGAPYFLLVVVPAEEVQRSDNLSVQEISPHSHTIAQGHIAIVILVLVQIVMKATEPIPALSPIASSATPQALKKAIKTK